MTLDRRVLILYAAAGAVCIKEFKKKKKKCFCVRVCEEEAISKF